MARPRSGWYEERSSRHEGNTLYDQPRSERHNRDDRSYDRRDDWTCSHDGDRWGYEGGDCQDGRRNERNVFQSQSLPVMCGELKVQGLKGVLTGVKTLLLQDPVSLDHSQ